MMKPLNYTIIEYQSFGVDEIVKFWKKKETHKKAKQLPSQGSNSQGNTESPEDIAWKKKAEKFFKELEDFTKSKDNANFLKYDGKHKLKAQNYAGVIQTKSGALEILPKCFDVQSLNQSEEEQKTPPTAQKMQELYELKRLDPQDPSRSESSSNSQNLEGKNNIESARKLLHSFLKTLKNTPFKDSKISSLEASKLPILDCFIQMFCIELQSLVQKGIRNDYITTEDNRPYLKGKLLFKEQIAHNLIHKERFFTSNDEYSANIPPNRLILSTLLFLQSRATHSKTLLLLKQNLALFEGIPPSQNIQSDLRAIKDSRYFSHYDITLSWCKLFLQEKSFSPYAGENEAYALLFPMEKLFESYVGTMIAKSNPSHDIKLQTSQKFLIEENGKDLFKLKPDILIYSQNKGEGNKTEIKVLDTKWKLPSPKEAKHGVSQADLYQTWAYACKYEAQEVWIIYPQCPRTQEAQKELSQKVWSYKANYQPKPQAKSPHKDQQGKNSKVKIIFAPLPL